MTYSRNLKRPGEFTEIMTSLAPKNRPVMSYPPKVQAADRFVTAMANELDDLATLPIRARREIADWVLNFAERFAVMDARPVFDMDGNGPQCSTCTQPWPLCGHHHLTYQNLETEENQ